MRANIHQGMDVLIVYDASNVVRASIKEIIISLVIASILVILTVLIFLQDFRATLIPAIAIPVSLIGVFTAMNTLEFTPNTPTLFGLVLAIGIVSLDVQGLSSLPTGYDLPEDKGILMVVEQLPSAASRQAHMRFRRKLRTHSLKCLELNTTSPLRATR